MIERLINMERPYGEPEYSRLSAEAVQLKSLLHDRIGSEEKDLLEQLENIYIRRETAVLNDAFLEGFWSAIESALEFQKWKPDTK